MRTPLVLPVEERPRADHRQRAPASPMRTPLVLPIEERASRRRSREPATAAPQGPTAAVVGEETDDALASRRLALAPNVAPATAGTVHRSTAARRRAMLRAAVVVTLGALVATAAATVPYVRYRDQRQAAATLESRLQEMATQYDVTIAASETRAVRLATAQAHVNRLEDQLANLREAKVKTVVKTRTVTKEVPRWVPNGDAVAVEVTGFGDAISIHDVQLTHAYGFTDLVGIAVNKSKEPIGYAQLGCTFLDSDGNVLANGMVNKQDWNPGQSWGFTCSAQVDATGGILRVDEMS